DGSVIEKSDAIVIHDSKETLMLAEESRSKMIQKQNKPIMSEKKETLILVEESRSKMIQKQNKPIMSEKKVNTKPIDYAALNQHSKDFETRFVPQAELSAEQAFWSSMVNSSLKKLKFHLASFDMAVEQHCVELTKFQDKMKNVLKDNERLLEQAISVDIVNIVMHDHMNSAYKTVNVCERCVPVETELQTEFIKKECYDTLFKKYNTLEKHCVSLEVDYQLKKEIFQRNNSFSQQSASTFDQLFEINDWKAQSKEKETVIVKLKERLKSLSDVAPLAPKLRNNKTAHTDYLRHTQEETATLREIVESERLINPLNTSLDYALKRKIWQSTGKMFITIEHIWRPTRRTFTLVRNVCPLTRIATTAIVPLREPIPIESNTDKPVVTLVYFRKSKAAKKKVPVSNLKINKSVVVQIVLWYLDSGCSKHMTGDHSQLINFVHKFLSMVNFGNDHVAKIMGYDDYKIGNVTISRVYFVEGLGHNLFSVGQFCDSDLEVAFRQHTCFIRNLDGVDLLTGSRGNNLYTLSLQDMMASSPSCLLSKASKTKSWLWHRRLSYLNFGKINHLARQGLVRGLPKLKFKKDHLCSACAMGKSMKKSHKPKSEDTNQEKLYLLHMDLCGPMRVESVNEKMYILVIVDDYSRFTWVKFLRSKDEALDFIITFLKMIQVRLKVPVRRIRTDNRTEFVSQTLRKYYEEFGISLETSVARSPQQNEDVATACFTQNQSIIRLRHGKTPYELLHKKLPNLSYLHVFGALCYPTNDSENLEKLQPKANIGIFIGYAPTKKAFRIYNRRTRRIVETIHLDFDELTAVASEQSSSGPALNEMTPATISSGLVQKYSSSTPYVRNDWDLLFQPMFDELLNPPPSVDHQAAKVIASIAEVIPLIQADSTIIPQDVKVYNLDIEVAHMGNDPLIGVSILEVTSAQSSSTPKTYKEVLTQSCWIEAMQEELNEFEWLEVWELVPRLDKVMVITLKKQMRLKRDKSEQKRTKPDKKGKRVEAGKSLKQLQ
nr:retrovirus-related Pol polyprotein from transposon TNT 1-94 [Tanacetum cinerariifolium]